MARQVFRLRGANWLGGAGFWVLTISGVSMGLAYVVLQGIVEADEPQSQLVIVLRAVAVIFGPVLFALFCRTLKELSVVADEVGIAYHSHLPDMGQHRPWKIPWKDIRSVHLAEKSRTGNPLHAELVIELDGKEQRITPWHWVSEEDPPPLFTLKVPKTKKKIRAALLKSPLVEMFRSRGLFVEEPLAEDTTDPFDQNRAAQVSVVLFVALVMYFIFDEYIGLMEFYVSTPPYHLMGIMGLTSGLVALQCLPDQPDMIVRSRAVAILLGCSVAFAAHPALLRLNAWTDSEGFQSYSYTRAAQGAWHSSFDDEAPPLNFGVDSRYWREFVVGDEKVFQIRSGPLGFKQINMAPLYKEQRAYYERGVMPEGATGAVGARQ